MTKNTFDDVLSIPEMDASSVSSVESINLATDNSVSRRRMGVAKAPDMFEVIGDRSARPLMSTVVSYLDGKKNISPEVKEISLSLCRVFIARKSGSSNWFSNKEFQRFINSIGQMTERIQQHSDNNNQEQSYVKYHNDRILSLTLGDQSGLEPEKPAWVKSPLYSGWLRLFIRRMISHRDVSFAYSLQKGAKQAWPSLGESKLQQALRDHQIRLSSSKGPVSAGLACQIERTSQEIFGGCVTRPCRNSFPQVLPAYKLPAA